MSHEHHEHCCEHDDLRYCKVCRVVYCKGCGKEWRNKNWYNTYPPYPQWTYTVSLGSVDAGRGTMAAVPTTGSCVHN